MLLLQDSTASWDPGSLTQTLFILPLILSFYYFVCYRKNIKGCGPFFLLSMFLVVGTTELAEGLAFLEISLFSARQFLNSQMDATGAYRFSI